jgi:hypothetical protein
MSSILALLFYSILSIGGFIPEGTTNSKHKQDISQLHELYTELNLHNKGLSQIAFDQAIDGWLQLKQTNCLQNSSRLAVADFSLSANVKRLFLIDVPGKKLLLQTYVAHGRNTGEEFAQSFSNQPGSFQSSPGFYLTGNTYSGKHGYSLQLTGLQKGINDLAFNRAIVLHGANYVSESFIQNNGRLGRSLGCPAVPEDQATQIIDEIKGGSCLYIYSPGTPALELN